MKIHKEQNKLNQLNDYLRKLNLTYWRSFLNQAWGDWKKAEKKSLK